MEGRAVRLRHLEVGAPRAGGEVRLVDERVPPVAGKVSRDGEVSILAGMVRELGAWYRQFTGGGSATLAPLPVQYADYSVWQRQWLQGEVLEAELALLPRPAHVTGLAVPFADDAAARPYDAEAVRRFHQALRQTALTWSGRQGPRASTPGRVVTCPNPSRGRAARPRRGPNLASSRRTPGAFFMRFFFAQSRQSSITRAGSGHDGMTSIGVPGTSTVKRPRLKTMLSRIGSPALTVALV